MTETEFLNLIDATFAKIEQAISLLDPDIDCEQGDGMLKLLFPNKTLVVLNKQTPIKQLWLAGKHQGYHFDYIDNEWIDNRSKRTFSLILNEVLSDAAGKNITLDIT